MRVLERERRPATEQEQRILARWSGWGALPVIFNPRPARAAFDADDVFERAAARWEAVGDLREQIRALLTEDEWAAARRNTINAHYTDADLVRSIWDAMRQLGFRGGRVLEPGSGSGNFIGFAPILTHEPVRMTGVEVEPTTAAIARHLYPDAQIISSGLEEVPLADGGFDGVVGNVPFGRYKRFDKVHNPDLALSIHDHFVLKSLYATRPGGIVALITSRYTLDAENPGARERMYQLGDLVGAVRLPARAHAAAAGTDVVTDVLFLRRRMDGEEPGDKTWLTARKRVLPGHDDELAVNTYFDAHPEYVLGELRAGSREWGPEVTVVGRTDQAPAEALAAAAAAISVEARAAGLTAAADQRTEPVQTIVTSGTEGALGLDAEGNPTIIDGGRPVPLEIHPDQREQMVQLIRLKGLTLALYAAEADTPEPGETPQLARLRAELRVAWRDYRKSHPPLTKPRQHYKFTPPEARAQATAQGLKDVPESWKQRTAFAWIDDDPDASLLFGLEEWDDRTGKGIEQDVLLRRVLEPRSLPVRANSHEDAIALAMEYDGGRLDMGRVAGLLGMDEESAAAQCADAGLAYRDPEQGDAWEPSHRYLSGNVRTKLAAARARVAEDPTFQGNVAALERVQPDDLAPSEIKAKIGAPWIPVDVYNDFLAHLGFEDAGVLHAGGTVWEVRGAKNGDLARTEWGTGPRPAQDLFTALLRQTESTIQVTYTDHEGRTYVDKDATDAAQEKAKLIAEAWDDWVWADETRATRLAGLYNEAFNNLVMPTYSGAPLTLPGLINDWTMKEHQNAAIRRIVNEPTALLAHVVGAGKTATMAAGAMELRRTGLARKPCIIVPNHMLKQWSREFRQLYPNAKILAITASDLSKKNRAKFMGRIAGGDWDAVILTHNAFNVVPVRPETQRAYLDREMKSLREQLDIAAESGMHRNTVKQIEQSLANAEAKLQQQIESMADDNGVFLEDTGIDYVFLDEAHEYKNLRTVSAIPGAAIQGSAKATKLHMVLSWLRETNESERVATLATGTPIANSVTEAYVLKRYLAPHLLDEMGLDAFDNWAATFGEVVSQLEPDPKGDGYRYKARFSRFFNVPELMAAYRTFADVQMAEDLDLPTPPVRESDGQRGETVLIPPTPAQRQFIKELPHKPWVRKPGGVLKALGEGLRASVDLDLVDATEALRNLGVTPGQITSVDPATGEAVLDFTKIGDLADAAATDMRSVGGSKEMGSKIPYAADKIAEIWQETKDIVYPVSADDPTPQDLPGGLQLVFLDEGTPGSTAKHAADLYADLRDELVARGMPRESIRFIHEAGTDRKKEKLFADCRAGRVRVLIGSTQKMGTGTNIQDRAVALHHLSYPWRPADMAQRDGRIERRGNLNAPWVDNTPDDVRIIYYITERTFDEFRLTTLARKARFIGQIQRRDFSAREIEDIGADAINIGMLAALASGDPAILQLAEATAERARLQGLARSWDRQQDTRTQQLTDIDEFLARAETALEGMRAAAPDRCPTTGDHFALTVEDATYRSRDAAADALGARMVAIAGDQSIRPGERIPVGTFGGQDFHAEIAYGASGRRQLRLRFAWGHVVPMGQREDRAQWQASSVTRSNGRGAIQSLEHFLNHLDDDLDKLDESVASARERREEIAANLRQKDENPYRIQARSKEREERALGKLVVANEKEAALAERVERAASVDEGAAEEVNEELAALREHIADLRKTIEDEHHIQQQGQALARGDINLESAPVVAHPDAEAASAEVASGGEGERAAGSERAVGSSSAAAERQDDAPPTELRERPVLDQPAPDTAAATASERHQPAPEPAAPEDAAERSLPSSDVEPEERKASEADVSPAVDTNLELQPPPGQEVPAPAPAETEGEAEPRTGPSPAMARCAAVLRYYEPLLQRHKLSGRDVVAYIDRPGVGYSYDPDNPFLDLVHEIGKVGERLGGSFRRSYHEWVHYQVGERRAAQSEQMTSLSMDLLTLYGDQTEPLLTVDLETILAASPGTVIELESEAELEAADAAAARILIIHDAEGTEVRNTPRGGDQRIREALHDLGFRWSRRQQKWYQQRNTPFDHRDTAVRGLRAAFEQMGVPYTYDGPDPGPQDAEEATETGPETTAAPVGQEPAGPAAETADPAPGPEPDGSAAEADSEPEIQLDLFGTTAEASPDGPPDDGTDAAEDTKTAPPAVAEPEPPAMEVEPVADPAADIRAPDSEPEGAVADPEPAPPTDPAQEDPADPTAAQDPAETGPAPAIGSEEGQTAPAVDEAAAHEPIATAYQPFTDHTANQHAAGEGQEAGGEVHPSPKALPPARDEETAIASQTSSAGQLGLFGPGEASAERSAPPADAPGPEPARELEAAEPRPAPAQPTGADARTRSEASPVEPEEAAASDRDEGAGTTPQAPTAAPSGDEDATDSPDATDVPADVEPPDATDSPPALTATESGETLPIEDPPVPDWYTEGLVGTPAVTDGTDEVPSPLEALAAQAQTAAPDRTEETPMAAPTEPAEADLARVVTPAQVQDWDGRYFLHLSGLPDQEPDAGEVSFGVPEGYSVLVATLHRSATNRWFARVAAGAAGVPDDVTPLASTPQEAARQGAKLWSYTTGQPLGNEPAAFRRQGPVSRSDALRTELGRFLDEAQQAVQAAAARAWPSTYGQLAELQRLGELFDGLQPWQRPDSPAGTANGAIQIVERLKTLQQAAGAWRDSLRPGTDARQHMAYPLTLVVGESARLQQQITATVEEVSAERAATRAEEDAQHLAASADDVAPEESQKTASESAAAASAMPWEGQPDTRPEPPAEELGDALQARALARAAAAPSRDQQEVPLWTGTDLPTGAWREEGGVLYDAYGVPQWRLKTAPGAQPSATETPGDDTPAPDGDPYEPVGIKEAFASTVAEAWADIVPPEHGTVEDLLEAVDAPLRELEEQWQRAVPAERADRAQQAAPASDDQDDAAPPRRRDPEPVNEALRQADEHSAALQNFPEWQRLQTVRGATAHLWNVLREKAGAYFEQLRNDIRVQGFWRTISIRTTAVLATGAQALADLAARGRRGGDLPTAQALLGLGDAALTYSTPGIPRPDRQAPDSAADDVAAEVQQLRTTLRTGAPVPYGTREEAAQASREVAEAFQAWRDTPMGQELTTASEHPRVAAFRQAWQRLPAADLPDGPGTAAGPYGDVGRTAQQLVERAAAANVRHAQAGQPPRFAEGDVEALRALATLAEHHGGRLAVTLPPGLTAAAPAPRAAAPQVDAPRPRVAAPAAPAGSRGMSA
ncbi:SNF2-related protein [Streptomyces sp. NPDC020490]|uniref:SNF2-related protein n=1 Tax=Streptomyces sp. NPDC020490 TaxID=3365078 RepID=UPI0037A86DEC